jgi:flavin reductase (DIM6/NTAB) family NADH-FMN oxidoreductase RutF
MAKVRTENAEGFYHFYPKLATVVTVRSGEKRNALAIAWGCPISREPPIYGVSISPKRYSHGLILEAGEFAVNFLPLEARKLIAAVGRTSGWELDKFERFEIEVEQPLKLSVPIIRQAYAAYECKLLEHRTWGDHDWFVGRILAVHQEEGAFSSDGMVEFDRITPALYLGGDFYLEMEKRAVHRVGREEALQS